MFTKNEHSKQITAAKRVAAFVLMAVVCFASVMSVMAANVKVTVIDGDKSVSVETARLIVGDILKEAKSSGIDEITGYDEAILDKDSKTLTIYREKTATLYDGGSVYSFKVSSYNMDQKSIIETCVKDCGIAGVSDIDEVSYNSQKNAVTIKRGFDVSLTNGTKTTKVLAHFGDTVGDLLKNQEIIPGTDDEISVPLSTKLTADMSVTYKALAKITVAADGVTKDYTVDVNTVGNVLSKLGITIGSEDQISEDLFTVVHSGMTISIGRVTYNNVSVEEVINYGVDEINSSSLYSGTTSVQTEGQEGTRKIEKKQKLVDGTVVSEDILSDVVVKAPVNKVVLVGTKTYQGSISTSAGVGSFIDYNGNTVNYSSLYIGKCTAYTGGGNTATGVPAAFGYVAVNPNVIPYGTHLYIASADGSFVYGYAIAADTGGALASGSCIADCYYDTLGECYQFGVRTMNVYVVG